VAEKRQGWSSSLVVGLGSTTPHRKETSFLRNITQGLGTEKILCNDLGNGKWM